MIPGPPRKRRRWAALLRARLPVHEDRGPLGAREGARRLERAGVGAVEDARRHRAATSSSKRNMRFRGSKRGRFGKKLLLGDRVSAGTSAGADTGVDGGVGAGARAGGVIRHSTSHEHAIWDRNPRLEAKNCPIWHVRPEQGSGGCTQSRLWGKRPRALRKTPDRRAAWRLWAKLLMSVPPLVLLAASTWSKYSEKNVKSSVVGKTFDAGGSRRFACIKGFAHNRKIGARLGPPPGDNCTRCREERPPSPRACRA